MKFASISEYEEMASNIELHIQKLLEEHNYDTISNFLTFYQGFRESGCSKLIDYFQSYRPPIIPFRYTCVGLALELWTKLHELDSIFPNLSDHLYLVSCEEGVDTITDYTSLNDCLDTIVYCLEKEHVMLALRFEIAGRNGVLICDPGYHVGRVITVMQDKTYPHTGWFVQSKTNNNITKEYNYHFTPLNSNFVQWNICDTRNGIPQITTSVVYVSKPYLTAVDVTERRNLVYNFRSLLSRNSKGQLIAGIYFKVKENSDEFTIFYQDHGNQKTKLNFAMFQNNLLITPSTKRVINLCNEQLNLSENSLYMILTLLAEMWNDKDYIKQLLEINGDVEEMAEED